MDTQPRPDDLTDLERRLASCAPCADGLDADAMLFAAGRASARTRLAWPALAAVLALLSAGLGAWLTAERAERMELARRLDQPPPAPAPPPAVPPAPAAPQPPTAEQTPGSSVLASHQALEHGLDAWPPVALPGAEPPSPEPPVLRVGRPDSLPDL
ncbi:MAG TPA: hypothetical protein VFW33_21270 [Gemmataceae bacterium]|nr:hypothetical protein [Gemmataceae bacterium]